MLMHTLNGNAALKNQWGHHNEVKTSVQAKNDSIITFK